LASQSLKKSKREAAIGSRIRELHEVQGFVFEKPERVCYDGLAGKITADDWAALYAKQTQRIKEHCWHRFTWHWRKRRLKPPPEGLEPAEYSRLLRELWAGGR